MSDLACLIAAFAAALFVAIIAGLAVVAWRCRGADPLSFQADQCRGGEFLSSKDHHLRHSGGVPARPGGDRTSGMPTWTWEEWSAGDDGEDDR